MTTLTIVAGGAVALPERRVRPTGRSGAVGSRRAVPAARAARATGGAPAVPSTSAVPAAPIRPAAPVGLARPAMPAARADAVRPTAMRPASMHLTRRGRLVVILLAVAIAFGVTLAATGASADGPVSAPQVERYVVAPGDTLWEIASGLAAPGEDVRDVVQEIVALNRMPSAGLLAGQEILLPTDR